MRTRPARFASLVPSLFAFAALASPNRALAATSAASTAAKPASTPRTNPVVAPKHADPPINDRPRLHLDVQKAKLPNGLRVVMQVDHTSPTVAVDVVYDVGSRNEEKGHSGFAHLFEHMMFQGSANVARGEHFKLVSGHGGQMNGTTNSDRTNYYELLPQNELELALWLEADRMKSLDISESNFENQRAVVKEEYRMRVENAAYVPAGMRLDELVFKGYWPYEHSTIGSMADLDGAQLAWVRAFHDSYYGPNNAIVSITGDFDPDAAMLLVTKWFGDAKPIAAIPAFAPAAPPTPAPSSEDTVTDAHAKLPAIFLGWRIPPARDADHYALEIVGSLLGDGESSRLHKKLVREKSLCVETSAGTDDRRGPDEFSVVAKLANGAKVDQVQAVLDAEILALAHSGPKAAELEKVKNRIAAGHVLGLQSNFARAQELARFELFFGDANLVNTELDKYLAVTADDVQRVAAKYLTKATRSRVIVTPGSAAKSAGGGK